jgi:glycosyltransferase involved in cell wall biosynthesis
MDRDTLAAELLGLSGGSVITKSHSRGAGVALVGSYPPPHGGQSVHIRNLSTYLCTQGMDVRVFNTGSNKDVREDGVVNIASSRDLLSALLFGSRFNLIHVHVSSADDFGKFAPVRMAALLRGSPWVVTIHSGNSADRLRTATLLRRAASQFLLEGAKKIICVNHIIQEELSRLLGPESIVVIPPFSVDFAGSRLESELEDFLTDHAPVLCCVGLYEPVYGFDQAVLLMTKVRELYPQAGLLLIGDKKSSDWCRTLISGISLERHVKLCGNLTHGECLGVMSRSALFLRPTRYDGDSLSVREALALGVPVVASATDFRPDGVTLYRAGVFQDLVDKVLSAIGTRGVDKRRAASDYGNLERIWQLYLEIMES